MGRVLSFRTWLRKGCEILPGRGRAQGWQILTLTQLQEKVFGSQGAAMGPWEEMPGKKPLLLSSSSPLISYFFKEKPIMGLPCSSSPHLCPPSCFPRALLVHPSLDTLWITSLCPHTGRVGAAPPYPLCSPQRAQRGTRRLRTRFSFILAGSWLFLPFPLALLQLTGCVAILRCLSGCAQEHLGVSSWADPWIRDPEEAQTPLPGTAG